MDIKASSVSSDIFYLYPDMYCMSNFPFRYDRKNLACLWDRQHSSPYFFIVLGSIVGGPTIITLYCYYQIFAKVRSSKNKVRTSRTQNGTCCLFWEQLKDNHVFWSHTLCASVPSLSIFVLALLKV